MLHLPLVLLLAAPAAVPPATTPAVSSLLAAEFAYADIIESKGVRAGNMKALRADSLVFIPRPVNGIDYYKTQLESGALLSWFPVAADAAQSGDLGYVTGPWTYRAGKDAPVLANGWFVTVWQREGNGDWKIRLDIQTPNPDPGERPAPPALPRAAAPALGPVAGAPGNPAELLEMERTFAKEAFKNSTTAYKARVDDNIRLYRTGRFPVEGIKKLEVALDPGTVTWSPIEGYVAAGGDLGWTRGTLTHQETATGPKVDSNYVRIWKKVAGSWKLVLDLELAKPKDKK